MDLKKYEVLLKVIDRGSINNVSYDLGYTHSGISKMLNSMESELGFQIIKRNNKGITLTSEGEELLPIIRSLVKENERIDEEIARINGIEKGTIRIGCFATVAFELIPDILKRFYARYPKIKVEVLEEHSIDRLEQWLNQGIIDVGVFSRQPYHNFEWFCQIEDEYVALLPLGHRLLKKDIISVEDLVKEKLILFKSHKGLDQDVVHILRYIDVKEYEGYTSNSDFMVIRMVEQNGFTTIIPNLIAKYARENFKVDSRPINVKLDRSIGFALKTKENISPSVRKFISVVRELQDGKE